jgi:hypothetical protein
MQPCREGMASFFYLERDGCPFKTRLSISVCVPTHTIPSYHGMSCFFLLLLYWFVGGKKMNCYIFSTLSEGNTIKHKQHDDERPYVDSRLEAPTHSPATRTGVFLRLSRV